MTVRRVAPPLLVALSVLAPAAVAAAGWSSTAQGSAGASGARLVNATAFTARCASKNGNSSVTLAWSITADTNVAGYYIVRTSSTGATVTSALIPRTTATGPDSPPTTPGVSYSYTIRATTSATAPSWTTTPLAAAGSPSYTNNSCSPV